MEGEGRPLQCLPSTQSSPRREEEFRGLSRGSEFVDCKTCAEDSVFYHLRPYLKPSVVDTPRPHSSLVEPGSEPRWDPDVLLLGKKGYEEALWME